MTAPTADRMPARTRAVGLVLLLAVAALYVATSAYERTHVDTASANLGAWRVATTGSPVLDGVEVDSLHGAAVPLWVFERSDGHSVVVRTPGAVAAGVPAYWVASVLGQDGTRAADYSDVPGVVTAALLTALSVLLVWLALLPRWGPTRATVAGGVLALATPLWSVAGNALWPHTVTVLGIAGMAWGASRERWWLVGVFGGVAFWGRAHTVLITAALAVTIAWARREPRIALVVGGIGAAFAAGASAWTHWVWGSWVPTGGYDPAGYVGRFGSAEPSFASSPWGVVQNELGLLVAPDRGILVWTPLVLLLLPALVRSWRGQPLWTRALAAGGLAYTLVQGLLNVFHGGDGIYGYRLTLELLVSLTPALVHAVPCCGRVARNLLGPVIGLQATAIALGAVLDRFSLTLDDVWTDNSFAAAVREAPALLLLAACATAIGWLGQRRLAEAGGTATEAGRA